MCSTRFKGQPQAAYDDNSSDAGTNDPSMQPAVPAAKHDHTYQTGGQQFDKDHSQQAAMQLAAAEHGSAPLFSLSQGCPMDAFQGGPKIVEKLEKFWLSIELTFTGLTCSRS